MVEKEFIPEYGYDVYSVDGAEVTEEDGKFWCNFHGGKVCDHVLAVQEFLGHTVVEVSSVEPIIEGTVVDPLPSGEMTPPLTNDGLPQPPTVDTQSLS